MERHFAKKKIVRGIAVFLGAVLILHLTSCGGADGGSPTSSAQPGGSAAGSQATQPALAESEVRAGSLSRAEMKEESVHVRTTADGSPTETKVSVLLSGATEADFVEDVTNLTGIRNREGDEEFLLLENGGLFFENHGEDIRYEGASEEDLPFAVHITYRLNGEEIAPEDLSGKSGEVSIRFDYENRTKERCEVNGKTVEMAVPMTAISLVLLPEDVFSNITVKNGRLIDFSGQKVALGIAMPGLSDGLALDASELTERIELPEYVEITARAEKCKLDFTGTIVSPGLLSGLGKDEEETEETEGEDSRDIDDLFDSMDDLKEASAELVDGTGKLADGAKEFGDGLSSYVDGASQLSSGASSLASGASSLSSGASELSKQSETLTGGASQLASGLAGLRDGLAQIDTAQLNSLSQIDVSALQSAISSVDLSGIEGAIRTALGDEAAAPISALSQNLAQVQSAVGQLAALPAAAGQLSQAVSALQSGADQLVSGANSLSEGIAAYTGGVSQLASGASQVSSGATQVSNGASQLANSGKTLNDGYKELQDGILELKNGLAKFDEEGIQELTRAIGTELKSVVDRYRAAKDLDADYRNFSGIFEGQEGSVRFIFESEGI